MVSVLPEKEALASKDWTTPPSPMMSPPFTATASVSEKLPSCGSNGEEPALP